MGSKPPAAVGERISKDERHGLGAAARWSTKAFSSEQKLVEHIGSGSTRSAEQLSPCIACAIHALATLRVCVPVCLHGETRLPSIML